MITVPNLLTLLRLFLVFPICLLMMGGWFAQFLALILYIAAAGSDYLDGYLARKWDQMSDFGRMLDPIVDKVMVAALFIMLVANHTLAGIWLLCPILILGREFLVAGIREYLGPKGKIILVSKLAKWKTTSQMVAIGLLMVPIGLIQAVGALVLLAATFLTVITALEYLHDVRV